MKWDDLRGSKDVGARTPPKALFWLVVLIAAAAGFATMWLKG